MIDWTEITDNQEVVELLKQRELIEEKIKAIDKLVLIKYELAVLDL